MIGCRRADLAELIRSKAAELKVNGPLPEVWGDRDRLGQLLANLITNGLKYNDKADPRVEVGTLPDGRRQRRGRSRRLGHRLRPR